MLNLFVGTVGTCSLASHIALEEAGAMYTITQLDFGLNEQRGAEFKKINPKGRVPALATDEGIISETPAVLFYIGQTHPAAHLIPNEPFATGKMQDFNAYLCSTVHPAHAHMRRGARWSDEPTVIEALKIKVPQNMRDCFTIIETDYFKGPWVMGRQFTVADPYLYTLSSWLERDNVDIKQFPKVNDHFNRMAQRPAVKKAIAFYA